MELINNNQVPEGYKETEIGLIPEDWEVKDISALCLLQRGFDITESTRKFGNVPVYSSSGLAYFHNQAKVNPPGVVTGRKGILGKVFYIEEPFWPHDTTLWIKDFKGNDAKYISFFLTYFNLERFDASTSVPTLNRNNLATISIPVPPLPEQKAIAQTLSDVDALIDALDKLIAKKRNIKTATMQQLLTGKTRLPGFDGEWEIFNLGDLFEITAGGDLVKSEYSEIQTNTYPYPIFANSVINGGLYGYSSFKEYKGDCITITARGTLGLACYRHTSFVAIGRLLVLNPRFKLDAFFLAEAINHQIQFANESTGVPQLTAPQTAQYRLSIPKLEEQKAIASILSDMNKEITALEKRRAKTQAIKQGMMQELLTGRTRLINN